MKNINKMIYILGSIFSIMTMSVSATNTPSVEWTKSYNSDVIDGIATYGEQTLDGGYIIATMGAGIIKADSAGNEIWRKHYYGINPFNNPKSGSVIQTSDGGYMIIGNDRAWDNPETYVRMIKTSPNGDEYWRRQFPINKDILDYRLSFDRTSDNGYIIAQTYGGDSIQIIKTDENGIQQWNRIINFGELARIRQVSDGGYVILGSRLWLSKLDSSGNEQWKKNFGNIGYGDTSTFESFQQITDGGYIIAGKTNRYAVPAGGGWLYDDAWIVKTDQNGNEVWNNTFGGTRREAARSIVQSIDGGYIIVGIKEINNDQDGWVIKTGQNGNEMWNKTFGNDDVNEIYSIMKTLDGGYILAGRVHIAPQDNPTDLGCCFYPWLMKLSSDNPDNISPIVIITTPVEGTHYRSTTLPELSYSVTDNLDTNPTILVTGWSIDEGIHIITINATDYTGNVGSASVTYIIDNTQPVIALNGNNPIAIYVGSIYTDSGATATDNFDGSVHIITTGSVDTNAVGTYAIIYTATDSAGNSASVTRIVKVIYNFSGFFQPIDNLPTWNSVKAGSAIPVKFSIYGDHGLDIFATGYPTSQRINCDSNAHIDTIEETAAAGSSSLAYNAVTDQYNYIWKTDKVWTNTCRQLAVLLKDGTYHNASFKFLK